MAEITVAAGDTLGSLARKHGTTVDAFVATNNISNPNLIRVGQVLMLPGTEADVAAEADGFDAWKEIVRERFPGFAWALDHEELGPILETAAEGEYSAETFNAQLRATDWFTSRTESQRAWDAFEADTANEAELADRLAGSEAEVRAVASRLGANVSDEQLAQLGRRRLRSGLEDDEVIGELLASSGAFAPGAFTSAQTNIQATAADFLVEIDDETIQSMAGKVVSGEMTGENVVEYARGIAKQRFPSMAEMIDKGISLREYTAPHRKLIADMLGRTAEDIDLTGEFRDVLSIGDANGPRPMSLSEVEKYVRSGDEYWQGRQGQEEVFGFVDGLSQALGVRR